MGRKSPEERIAEGERFLAELEASEPDEEPAIRQARIEIIKAEVYMARGELLPQECRAALQLLVDSATERELGETPRPLVNDKGQQVRPETWRRDIADQIEQRLLAALFR